MFSVVCQKTTIGNSLTHAYTEDSDVQCSEFRGSSRPANQLINRYIEQSVSP